MKKAKTILLLTILLFGVFLTINFVRAAELAQYQGTWEEEQPKGKALEIVYPKIPGDTTTITIASGLPEYVDYILKFAMLIIGFVILGALIYSGIQWLTSTGKPEQLSSAKQGIISAFLGAVILFSAYLIFNTINPQLTILEPIPPDVIEPVVPPGIYLCNYKLPIDFFSIIQEYQSEDKDKNIEAAKKIKDKMRNDQGSCYRVNFSANLATFVFDGTRHDAFAIPRKEYVYTPATETTPAGTEEVWKYDYGIIFHEKDNFGRDIKSKCYIGTVYGTIFHEKDSFGGRCAIGTECGVITYPIFKTRSVTLFEKPSIEPSSERQGIILYQCIAYNEGGKDFCPAGLKEGTAGWAPFATGGSDVRAVGQDELIKWNLAAPEKERQDEYGRWYPVPDQPQENTNGTRSIKVDPAGSYFAILFSEDNFTGETCEVISRNDNNLLDNPIGRCGANCEGIAGWVTGFFSTELERCLPCLKSMIVVKGNVIY